MTGPRVVGLSAGDGKLLWSHPFQIQYDESISTPAVANDLVLITATGRPLTALRITRDGKKWNKQVAWTNNILSSYLSSMVVEAAHVYGMNDGGEFSCLNAADGKALWTGGNHGYYSSPIVIGKRLLAPQRAGAVGDSFDTDPGGFKELGASQLGASETWTMPAVVGSRILRPQARTVWPRFRDAVFSRGRFKAAWRRVHDRCFACRVKQWESPPPL